ncbi:transmembrane protease serine 9, partial [Nephila pilipes]
RDAGAPFIIKHEGRWHVVGIFTKLSKVEASSESTSYFEGRYILVVDFLTWIRNIIGTAPSCPRKLPIEVPTNFDECGIPNENAEGRIAGGNQAKPFEFPWMATIRYRKDAVNELQGAGSLISPTFVLTAASITQHIQAKHEYQKNPEQFIRDHFLVFLGKHANNANIEGNNPGEPFSQQLPVKKLHLHPNYSESVNSPNSNLALLELGWPARVYFRPICLPQKDTHYLVDTNLTIAGWGATAQNGPNSQNLHKAGVSVFNTGQHQTDVSSFYGIGKDICMVVCQLFYPFITVVSEESIQKSSN